MVFVVLTTIDLLWEVLTCFAFHCQVMNAATVHPIV